MLLLSLSRSSSPFTNIIVPLLLLVYNFVIVVHSDDSIPFVQQQQEQERQLAFVQCVWRHGDRAPNELPYPGDPYDESHWPRGWSQLTNLGMDQMREVGQFLRERYIQNQQQFLNARYDVDEVFVQSSDSARALTSAQALLYGMYPALDATEQFDPNLQWQPIPVHSTGPNNELLKPTSFECPAYERLEEDVHKHLERHLQVVYKDLFEFLRTTVYNTSKQVTLKQAAKLNNVQREVIHNMTQPDWINKRWPQYSNMTTLDLVLDLKRQERVNDFKHPALAYLRGGYLLGDWLRRAVNVTSGKCPKEAEKAVLYSAHDGTLLALLYAMGVGDDQMVPYASIVCMEIYRSGNASSSSSGSSNDPATYQIDIFYRRSGQLQPLNICGCKIAHCPAADAIRLLKPRAIWDRKKLFEMCKNQGYCEVSHSEADDSAD